MKNLRKKNIHDLLLITVLALSAGLFITGLVYADSEINPVERPAMMSVRAETSVLLSVTKAGHRLVAVGERGHIMLSEDNGGSWEQVPTPVSVTLTGVRFVNDKVGWALGHSGVVLHTTDGGKTWVKQLDGVTAANMACRAAEKQLGAASEEDRKKCQKLLNFTQLLVDDGPDKPFFDIYCKNEKECFVVGAYNLILRTKDGGNSWEPWLSHVENPRGLHLYAIESADDKLLIAGEQGLLLRSDDDGMTFYKVPTPYYGSLFGIRKLKSGEILIYGLRGNAFISDDYGDNWRKIDTGARLAITGAIDTCSGNLVFTTQSGIVLGSSDKGKTVQRLSIGESFAFSDITQAHNLNLIIAGMRGIKVIPNIDEMIQSDANSITMYGDNK